jgi:hypothetical protein
LVPEGLFVDLVAGLLGSSSQQQRGIEGFGTLGNKE